MFKPLTRGAVGAGLLVAGLLLSFSLPRPGAAQQGRGQGPEFIPGHYIVVLKEPGLDSGAVAAQMARGHGLGIGHVYHAALNGFSAVIPDARLADVAADPRVAYIERDRIVRLDPTARKPGGGGGGGGKPSQQTIPWGITRIGGQISSTQSGNNAGDVNVDIAIIDTGIARVADLNVVGGVSFVGGDDADGHGHGTHVAGTAAARDNNLGVVGVVPGARLWSVRVLDNSGFGTYEGVLAGIDWVADRGDIEVANMSLTGGGDALNGAVNTAVARGTVIVVAAGNDHQNADGYTPAGAPDAITVSALDQSNNFAYFSNWGPVVDLIAPGVNVLSTSRTGGTTTMSGTSMASPHVAGAAALYRATHTSVTAAQVADALKLAGELPAAGHWGFYDDGVGEPLVRVSSF